MQQPLIHHHKFILQIPLKPHVLRPAHKYQPDPGIQLADYLGELKTIHGRHGIVRQDGVAEILLLLEPGEHGSRMIITCTVISPGTL